MKFTFAHRNPKNLHKIHFKWNLATISQGFWVTETDNRDRQNSGGWGWNQSLYTVFLAWEINACLIESTGTFWQTWVQTHQPTPQATGKMQFSAQTPNR